MEAVDTTATAVDTGAVETSAAVATTTGTKAAYSMHTGTTGSTGATGIAGPPKPNALNAAMEEMNEEFATLNPGSVALDCPERMRVASTSTVRLRVAQKGESVGTMSPAAKPEVLKGVTPVMSAHLESDNASMQIVPATEKQQMVAGTSFVEWRWYVTPLRSGKHQVIATVSGYLDPKGSGTAWTVYTRERDVMVDANFVDYITTHVDWKWAWGALIVPLAGWLWAMIQRRRKAATTST